nr:molybdenum cofactor guanylyltransferase MobA [uncultured Rhodoferax sp.]
MSSAFSLADVSALVLAGGRGARMGGVDKGLVCLNGRPLVRHVLQQLAAQQGGALAGVIISANRHAEVYRSEAQLHFAAEHVQVLPDRDGAFSGPLAGFQAGLGVCHTALMLTVPCDSPRFPQDLALRLLQALKAEDADLAVAVGPEAGESSVPVLRKQPVFCLMRQCVSDGLDAFLAAGGRKVGAWASGLRVAYAAFDAPGDDPHAFSNANTAEELSRLEGL